MEIYKNQLIDNVNKIYTTDLGVLRIKKNLSIENKDVVELCKQCILDDTSIVEKIGKNYYVYWNNYKFTVNSSSYTIITGHKIKN